MPSIESTESSSSRVTRSLRKRLTSVDTDSSSRPGTPVLSTLHTLQESATPSKRTTRRSSVSTPVPTPSKLKSRVDITEAVSSPARRTTRRRSVSTQEQDDFTLNTKSKEPTFDAVKEEEPTEKSPDMKSKGTKRSSPKSTSIRHSERATRSETPRSDTPNSDKPKRSDQTYKSPEVSPEMMKHMKHSKVLLKKEHIEESKSSPRKTPQRKSPIMILSSPEGEQDPKKADSKPTSTIEKQPTPDKSRETSPKNNNLNKTNSSIQKTPSQKEFEKSTENDTSLSGEEVAQISPLTKNKRGRPSKIKSVVFNNTAEEEGEKSVFPKTPGLTKSKSYILDSSKPEGNESINKSECKLDDSHEEIEKNSGKEDAIEDDNEHEIVGTKTPYKLKLNSVESSTPIQNTSIKKSKDESIQKENSIKASDGSKKDLSFPKSWSHSVSGTVNEMPKIDNIESEESKQKKLEEEKAIEQKANSSKSPKQKRKLRDDSEEEDLIDEGDDIMAYDEGDEEEDEKEREKSMFIDDEAMEVAEGEESMDSEERAYLEENEVPVYGESIGSEDTDDEEAVDEEEADEEDAAFVVSDTEEILHEESDSDDAKKSEKKYKRIIRNADDSSDDESGKGKEEDFCLILDSSMDETSHVSVKLDKELEAERSLSTLMKSAERETTDKEAVSPLKPKESLKNISSDDDGHSDMDANAEISDGDTERKSNKEQGEETDEETGTNEKRMNDVRKDRESLNGSKTSRKSIVTFEQDESEEEAEAVNNDKSKKEGRKSLLTLEKSGSHEEEESSILNKVKDADKSVSSPSKRRSLKKHEEIEESAMETEEQNPSSKDTDIEAPSSKNERKSLTKSKPDADMDKNDQSMASPFKRKSLKSNEDKVEIGTGSPFKRKSLKNMDEDQEADMGSPFRRKSVKGNEENVETGMSSPFKRKSLKGNEDIQETGSPNKLSSQEVSNTPNKKMAKKEKRKSLNSSHFVQEFNDEDIMDADNENSTETEEKETKNTSSRESLKNANISINKSKLKFQNDSEGDDKDGDSDNQKEDTDNDEQENISQNESEHKAGSDLETEHSPKVSTDEDKQDHTNSTDRESSKSPEEREIQLKKLRKSLNKSGQFNQVLEKSDHSNPEVDQMEDEEEEIDDKLHNLSNTSLNVSKNKKRKSLKRTSTEELSDDEQHRELPANKSKLEKSIHFVENDSEVEATTAFEVSLNSSRTKRKSMNQSISLKRDKETTKSPRKSTESGSSSNNDANSENEDEEEGESPTAESNDKNDEAEMSKVMEFLGEEESENITPPSLNSSRRKSLNKSKLDETFQLESHNSSRRDSLHRNVLKKSLNHSKIINESMQKTEDKSDDEDGDADADVSAMFSDDEEEDVEIVKKILPDKGLSVSLSGIECRKKKSRGSEGLVHKSFTIGVSLRNTAESSEKSEGSSPDSSAHSDDSMSEKDDLEKVENVQVVGPYRPRNSLSKITTKSRDEDKIKAKSKRFSLYNPEHGASQSFVENLAEEKKKLQSKRSRKSNSFCGAVEPFEEPEAQPDEPESPKSETQSNEPSKPEAKTDIQRILSRCDEILEAANRAKREAKLNAKKTKVKKPKWMDNEEKMKEEEEVKIPLVSKKELKRKEKMKKELAKAIKHSTAMLKTIDPKLVKKMKATEVKPEPIVAEEEPPVSSKRLPTDFLEELEEGPKPKKKKTKAEIESTPPSDKENSKRNSHKSQHRAEDGEKKKKKQSKEILETASGTVIVEPATPTKLRYQNGFRESPKTPVGFKIQDVDETNEKEKAKKRAKKLFATSAAFVEKDLPHSKTHSKKSKKPKLHIEEPVYSLPKTQWTSSGVFVEEDVYTVHHPLANSTATQFMVSSLGGGKNSKSSKVVSSATLSTALNFKKNTLFSEKVKRESARSLLHRKERKLINNRY